MTDNVTAPAAAAVFATDDIGGVHYPRTKLSVGADGTAVDVSAAAPLPVTAASLPLPAGAATSAKQDSLLAVVPASLGQKAKAASLAVTLASDEDLLTANAEYETVAASVSSQVIGATGASGDYLAGLLIVPATTSPGAVTIADGAGSAITVFTGGASSVSNLVPFYVPLGIKSTAGAWKVTTGAAVSVIASGNFT